MKPFKDKPGLKIAPGKTGGISLPLPLDAKGADKVRVVLQYEDEFGNEYETEIFFYLKTRKIKQEFRVVKKVKDLPAGDEPKLVLDENSINWPDI